MDLGLIGPWADKDPSRSRVEANPVARRLSVVVSDSAQARLQQAAQFLRGCPEGALVLAFSRGAGEELVRRLALERGATFAYLCTTLNRLAGEVATSALQSLKVVPAGGLGAEAVAARVAYETRFELSWFEPVADRPGFPAALAATLAELRGAGLGPQHLRSLPPPGPDLARLLQRYQDYLEAARLADRARLFGLAARLYQASRPVLLLDVPLWERCEVELVEALLRQAPQAMATVPRGDGETLAALRHLGGVEVAVDEPDQGSLARLRRGLFAAPRPGPEDGQVELFSAPGEARECVEVARRLLDAARGGLPFDEMAVLVHSPEIYGPLLESALRRAGVPAWFSRGTRLPHPAGRAFLALLRCAAEGLSARRFAEYLSLGQAPSPRAGGQPVWVGPRSELLGAAAQAAGPESEQMSEDIPGAAPAFSPESPLPPYGRWERLLVEAAVIGGRERWQRRLAGKAAELRLQIQELGQREPDSPLLAALERQRQHLEALARFALPLVERLAALPARGSWGEWLDHLEALAVCALAEPRRVLEVLAELRPMAAIEDVGLEEVLRVLSGRLPTLDCEPEGPRYGRVFVATPAEARGRSFRLVLAPGLAERLFPRKVSEDPLLLDSLRALLPGLPRQDERAGRERLALHLVVGAARERLCLSCPRLDVALCRPRVLSFYALDVARAVTGSLPDLADFEDRLARQGGARLAWPGPADPARAIDAVEHDLAVLGNLLRSGPERQGGAAYLLRLNPHLGRALRREYLRWRRPWSEADGLVDREGRLRPLLARHRLDQRPFSASTLQRFALCPYQFYLAALLRLEPRPQAEPLEEMDPLVRGSLVHQVQAQIMEPLRRAGLWPLKEGDLEAGRRVLDGVLDRVAQAFFEELAPAVPQVWQREVEALRADLHLWLQQLARRAQQWEPLHFELAFGLPRHQDGDAASSPDPVRLPGGFLLRGAVDWVERRREDGLLRVVDHKTGRPPWRERLVVGGGEVLQPLLYGLAVEALLGGEVGEGVLFYCTSQGRFQHRTVRLDSKNRQSLLEVLRIIDDHVGRGFLPPAPRERACQWCDFLPVCGQDEQKRWQQKDPRGLDDLQRLRGMP